MTELELIRAALEEDLGFGDITSRNLELENRILQAVLVSKGKGLLAGLKVFSQVFYEVDSETEVNLILQDGDKVKPGDQVAIIKGKARSLLEAERVALNFLQRLSGIATLTHQFVEKMGNSKTRLLDTRKTTPLLRHLEKYAVRVGGGYNHRFGLFDMIMLKENHIRSAGSIRRAVSLIRSQDTAHRIEVEVTNLGEVAEAYESGADRVMLDNMTLSEIKQAVSAYQGKIELEVSGNVTLETIGTIAATGVDYVSSGSLTHSFKSLDLSLLFEEQEKKNA